MSKTMLIIFLLILLIILVVYLLQPICASGFNIDICISVPRWKNYYFDFTGMRV